MRKFLLLLVAAVVAVACTVGLATTAKADIVADSMVYTIDGQPYEGYYAINEGFGDNQPMVLVIHDWNGLDDYEKRRTQMLAEQGFAAFAPDLYGQGVRPTNREESRAESGKLYSDRPTMRQRLMVGMEQAAMLDGVDSSRIAAIGYCFGGTAVLEMARAGADLDGFVSFHGGLSTPEGQDYASVEGPILILHGTADQSVPMADVANLAAELDQAKVDYSMELYGGADHAFTVWGGDRYDPQADIQSWDAMLTFLDKTLR